MTRPYNGDWLTVPAIVTSWPQLLAISRKDRHQAWDQKPRAAANFAGDQVHKPPHRLHSFVTWSKNYT